jgi:predicted DNA-binding WGR domain protein
MGSSGVEWGRVGSSGVEWGRVGSSGVVNVNGGLGNGAFPSAEQIDLDSCGHIIGLF